MWVSTSLIFCWLKCSCFKFYTRLTFVFVDHWRDAGKEGLSKPLRLCGFTGHPVKIWSSWSHTWGNYKLKQSAKNNSKRHSDWWRSIRSHFSGFSKVERRVKEFGVRNIKIDTTKMLNSNVECFIVWVACFPLNIVILYVVVLVQVLL